MTPETPREAGRQALDLGEARREIEGLTSWPRVQFFAYDAQIRGVPVNPTEDRVVIDRAAVLAIFDRLALAAPALDGPVWEAGRTADDVLREAGYRCPICGESHMPATSHSADDLREWEAAREARATEVAAGLAEIGTGGTPAFIRGYNVGYDDALLHVKEGVFAAAATGLPAAEGLREALVEYVRGHRDGLDCEAKGFGGRLDECEHVGRIDWTMEPGGQIRTGGPAGGLPTSQPGSALESTTLHETHVCRDCGAEIVMPYAVTPAGPTSPPPRRTP